MGVTPLETDKPMISAKLRGPGPARYSLPTGCGHNNHDCTKYKRPAYSFGLKTNSLYRKTCTPGPAHLVTSSISRYGSEGSAKFSMQSRHNTGSKFLTPSPNAYTAERTRPLREQTAPSYSMGTRSRNRKTDHVPSPNMYPLPSLIGPRIVNKDSSGAFSMYERAKVGAFDEDLAKTPGPCGYDKTTLDLYKHRKPIFTIQARSYLPGDNSKKPGPGAHCPEMVHANKKKAPSFTMGIRHSEYLCPLINTNTIEN